MLHCLPRDRSGCSLSALRVLFSQVKYLTATNKGSARGGVTLARKVALGSFLAAERGLEVCYVAVTCVQRLGSG